MRIASVSTDARTKDVAALAAEAPGRVAGAGRSASVRRLLARPELGAAAAAVLVWIVFALVAGPPFRSLEGTAAVLNAAAPLGILAVAVALLMIAGEFDLSIGSIIGCADSSRPESRPSTRYPARSVSRKSTRSIDCAPAMESRRAAGSDERQACGG